MITGATQFGDDRLFLSVDTDPRIDPVDCLAGSFIVFVPSGQLFYKKDDGLSTNVTHNVNIKSNFDATTVPTVTDDSSLFYSVGSLWINTSTDLIYICVDDTAGAAIWISLTSGQQGQQGPQGNQGFQGLQGSQGSQGTTPGPQGPQGPQGFQGEQGLQGSQGSGLAPSQQATATGDITTTSVTAVVATGMTLTPVAGTYLVWFSGSVENSTNAAITFVSIYSGGALVASSEERNQQSAAARSWPFCCVAKVTVNGAEAIEGRWRVNGNTGTMHQRNLTILNVA